MKRRSFLKSAAALLPAASLGAFATGEPSPASSAGDLNVVPSGEGRLGESFTRGYSTIHFKVLPHETANGLFVIEHTNLTKAGPALHLHVNQEEYFYVLEGEVVFQVGDARKHLKAGDSLVGPRGIPHAFAGTGEKPGRMLIAFTPAGKMEQFFRETTAGMDPAAWARYDLKYMGPSPFAG